MTEIVVTDEIVAARIGPRNIITNDTKVIISAMENNLPIEWLTRQRMQFMASLDLGDNWRRLAKGRTLFLMDDNGVYPAPVDGHDPRKPSP